MERKKLLPIQRRKIELYGEYPLKKDAERIKEELNRKLRKSLYEKAVENGETDQYVLQKILTREAWMQEKYSVFHITRSTKP